MTARAVILGLLGALLSAPAALPDQSPAGAEKGARKANRLAAEKSPYLLQHAHNPVDWYPWGEEAFKRARMEDRPVFLSIGYSTCHWCHVMERESFENEETARVLNEGFVAIKVDREERPDIDQVYMAAVQAFTRGHGGWPLSVFLTPEGKPFFGGTYFPPEDDPDRGPGFRTILGKVLELWKKDRSRLVSSADKVLELLEARAGTVEGAAGAARAASLVSTALEDGFQAIRRTYDSEHGGFGRGGMKFPRTSVLDFLLAYSARTGSAEARTMAFFTLDRMAEGGIRDHLGGGFHRYSTDPEWTVPHFEKMLYDQALIARTYLDAGRFAGERRYLDVARETLDYVLARLSTPEGGLLSAEDADSEGAEGRCYLWTRGEVLETLGAEDGKLFADFHGVGERGNFEGTERSVLTARKGREEFAKGAGLAPGELSRRLEASRRKLLDVRGRRPPPLRDDKALTDWNGLAISALARAYQATGEDRWLRAAERAADFVARRLSRDGRLLHRFRDGEAAIPAYLDDHAFLIEGLLDLYEAGFDPPRLREAVRLAKEMVRLFWDAGEGGFFPTGPDHERLLLRQKDFYDGALPSGNAVALLDLYRLVELTEDKELAARARSLEGVAARLLAEDPEAHPVLLAAAAFRLGPPLEIVVVGPPGDPGRRALVEALQRAYLPPRVLAAAAPADLAGLKGLLPLLEGKESQGGRSTVYVCRQRTCRLPATDLAGLKRALAE